MLHLDGNPPPPKSVIRLTTYINNGKMSINVKLLVHMYRNQIDVSSVK